LSDSYSDLVDHLNGGQALFPAYSLHAVLVLAKKHKRGAAESSISMVSDPSLSWRAKAVLKCAATAQNLPMRSRTIPLISGGQEVPCKLHREVVFPTLKIYGQEDVFDDYILLDISRRLAQCDFYLLRLETAEFVERLVGFGVIGPLTGPETVGQPQCRQPSAGLRRLSSSLAR
jgi:hypothetical protein